MADVHLTNNMSAAASLRAVYKRRPKLIGIGDIPEFGPLDDGERRAAYLEDTLGGGEWFGSDAFDRWRVAVSEIGAINPERIIVWVSRSGSDIVFLSMVAYFFTDLASKLWVNFVQAPDGFQGVGILSEEQLRQFLTTARPITADEASVLRSDFLTYAQRPEPLRLADANGKIKFCGDDHFDRDLLGHCSREWTRAPYVIGSTMGNGDPLNPVGDLFLLWRVRCLVDAGKLEAKGDHNGSMRGFEVRLAKAAETERKA